MEPVHNMFRTGRMGDSAEAEAIHQPTVAETSAWRVD